MITSIVIYYNILYYNDILSVVPISIIISIQSLSLSISLYLSLSLSLSNMCIYIYICIYTRRKFRGSSGRRGATVKAPGRIIRRSALGTGFVSCANEQRMCIYIYIYIHMCVYIRMYIHMYICICVYTTATHITTKC